MKLKFTKLMHRHFLIKMLFLQLLSPEFFPHLTVHRFLDIFNIREFSNHRFAVFFLFKKVIIIQNNPGEKKTTNK